MEEGEVLGYVVRDLEVCWLCVQGRRVRMLYFLSVLRIKYFSYRILLYCIVEW